MKNRKLSVIILMTLLATLALTLGACKSSGIAATSKGQIMHVDVDLPKELSEGETAELKVHLSNRGVNNIGNIVVEVEVPNELWVLSQDHEGTELSEERTSTGSHLYYYHLTELGVTKDASMKYQVQAKFGAAERSGDVKVTAYQKDLPGDKLIETKYVKVKM